MNENRQRGDHAFHDHDGDVRQKQELCGTEKAFIAETQRQRRQQPGPGDGESPAAECADNPLTCGFQQHGAERVVAD